MKKLFFLLLNIIAAIVAIITFCTIHIKFPEGNLIGILNSPVYEQTDEYYNLINERISNVLTLINLKIPFEYNNELNYDKIIAESIDSSGNLTKWTIGECLNNAIEHGVYIDSQHNMNILSDAKSIPFDKNIIYNFLLKTYPAHIRSGACTEQEFYTEVVNALSNYYKCSDYLKTGNTNFNYKIIFNNDLDNTNIAYTNCNLSNEEFLNSSAFIYISSKDGIINSNISNIDKDLLKKVRKNNPYPTSQFTFYISINNTFPTSDAFKESFDAYNLVKQECGSLITISIISIFLFIVSLFAILYFIFTSKKTIDDTQEFFQAIPTDFYLISYVILIISSIFLANRFISSNIISVKDLSSIKIFAYVLIIYIFTLLLFTILSNLYTKGSLHFLLFNAQKDSNNISTPSVPPAATLFIMFIPTVCFTIISFVLIYIYTQTAYKPIFILGIILLVASICLIIYLLLLHNSFEQALNVQVRSNNMRVSLITNVSHDIKTPLTSIINYTDLIGAEIQKPSKNFKKNLVHYSNIVNEKTNRLNDLINELIFESKVSTGNVNLDMKPLDLIPLISQILSEFKDKFVENNLKVIYEHNTNKSIIKADNKQLYRIFQNLLTNVYKYALEKSRVYIDVNTDRNKVAITIRNIQKEKLEVNVDSLKDRFVRGNKSRTTEGFGLGLSISESLVKSMNGKLDIKNIRDEFITIIKFVPYNE